MLASFAAELLKLGKRPATWILWTIFGLSIVLLGYLLTYLLLTALYGGASSQGPRQDAPVAAKGAVAELYPRNVLATTLRSFGGIGAGVAFIFGTLSVSGEYGWDTLKIVLTQRPGRLSVLAGKVTAVGVVVLVGAAAGLVLGALCSYSVSLAEGAPVSWPSAGRWLEALGAGWLILATNAYMGLFLAVLLRSGALSVGIGLVYLLVVEGLLTGLATFNDRLETFVGALPGRNSTDLAAAFGQGALAPQSGPLPAEPVEPQQAALVLAAYLTGFVVLSALVFTRREVTS